MGIDGKDGFSMLSSNWGGAIGQWKADALNVEASTTTQQLQVLQSKIRVKNLGELLPVSVDNTELTGPMV